MSFADFLDVMHQHSKVENLPDEVIAAFKAADPSGKGTIPAKQLRQLLQNWGEGLSAREVSTVIILFLKRTDSLILVSCMQVDNIFREANVSTLGAVRYSDFVKISCAPVPDYY